FAFVVRRTLDVVNPRIFVMMETEIWPNLLRVCRKRGVKTVMINGRISSRSYPRYRLARPFFKRVLANVDCFCMHREESARRRIDLGADASRVAGFATIRRSELPIDAEPRADVIVLDSIGELAQLYQLATVVFVGGSLVDHGGHNILEPAVVGKPIVFGPHMQNFKEIADLFV